MFEVYCPKYKELLYAKSNRELRTNYSYNLKLFPIFLQSLDGTRLTSLWYLIKHNSIIESLVKIFFHDYSLDNLQQLS